MPTRILIPQEATADVAAFLTLEAEQLDMLKKTLADAAGKGSFRPSEIVPKIAADLEVSVYRARSVFGVLTFMMRRMEETNSSAEDTATAVIEFAQEYLGGDKEVVRRVDALRKDIGPLSVLFSGATTDVLRRRIEELSYGPAPTLVDVETRCDVRPVFKPEDADEVKPGPIQGYIRLVHLTLHSVEENGEDLALSVTMNVDGLARLERALERAKKKLEVLTDALGGQLLDNTEK